MSQLLTVAVCSLTINRIQTLRKKLSRRVCVCFERMPWRIMLSQSRSQKEDVRNTEIQVLTWLVLWATLQRQIPGWTAIKAPPMCLERRKPKWYTMADLFNTFCILNSDTLFPLSHTGVFISPEDYRTQGCYIKKHTCFYFCTFPRFQQCKPSPAMKP